MQALDLGDIIRVVGRAAEVPEDQEGKTPKAQADDREGEPAAAQEARLLEDHSPAPEDAARNVIEQDDEADERIPADVPNYPKQPFDFHASEAF